MAGLTKFQFLPDLLQAKITTAITVLFRRYALHEMIGMNGVNGIRQPVQTAFNSC